MTDKDLQDNEMKVIEYNQQVMDEILGSRGRLLLAAKPIRANKPKEAPLVIIEDVMLMCGSDKITSCSLNLYGSDIPEGKDEPAGIDIRKVTISFKGEEVEVDNGEIADYLCEYYEENK